MSDLQGNNPLLLSIIVPVFNCSLYIWECLDSLLNQNISFEKYEILCVDDGSKDDSLKILREYENKYSCIKVFQKENGGVSSARNYALKKATGKYLMFVDSDDYICANCLADILDKAIKYDADIMKWGYRSVKASDPHFTLNEKIVFKKKSVLPAKAPSTLWRLMVKNTFISSNSLKFDERISYGEDALMSFLIYLYACNGVMLETESRVYNYRILEESLSHKLDTNTNDWYISRTENMLCRVEYCKSIKKQNLTKKQYKELDKKIANFVSTMIINILRMNSDNSAKYFSILKQKGLYPYAPFKCIHQYDVDNALTYKKNKGYRVKVFKHSIKNLAYNTLIVILSRERIYKLVHKFNLLK